jgi:curved DNA-binding protein CbpA
MAPDDDLYNRLGVGRDASPDEIKRAYRRASRHAHPDAEGGSPEKWGALTEAYDVLRDERRRRVYDDTGRVEASEPDLHMARLLLRLALAMEQIAEKSGGMAFQMIDWVGSIRNTLNAEIENIRNGIPVMEKRAREWAIVAGRSRAPADRPNALRDVANGKAAECLRRVEEGRREITERQEAIALLEGATFDFDTMPGPGAARYGMLGGMPSVFPRAQLGAEPKDRMW